MNFQPSRVLLTAVELRVFSLIGGGGLSSAEVAGRAASHPRATDRLLNALCAMQSARQARRAVLEHGRQPAVSRRRQPGLRRRARPHGQHVAQLERPDRRGPRGKACAARRHQRARRRMAEALHRGDALPRGAAGPRGGGACRPRRCRARPGRWRRVGRLCHGLRGGSPGLVAVVFDLPNVVPLTRDYIAKAGLTSRVTTAVGDYLVDPLPHGFDLVFLSAVVHSNAAEQNATLLKSCAAALNPGGRVAVVDWVMDDDRVTPPGGAVLRAQHARGHRPRRHLHRRRDPRLDDPCRACAGAENRDRLRHCHRHRERPFAGLTGNRRAHHRADDDDHRLRRWGRSPSSWRCG